MKIDNIRWGILGAGRIARKFAADLKLVEDAELVAIGSRNIENAKLFAAEFSCKYFHDSYEALVTNEDVDVIYVATPHSHHHAHTILCINNGKAVLCEKAFAINTRQAQEMINLASEKKIFLMEAMWTKFLPHYKKMQSLLQEKKLGDVKSVLLSFGFKPWADAPARLLDPVLGGGSLLDIGVYNVFMALSVLGKPDVINATMSPAKNGVDLQLAITFNYDNGTMAQLFSSFASNVPIQANINGTAASLMVSSKFFDQSATLILQQHESNTTTKVKVKKEKGLGYQLEARHVNECLKKGLTESPVMTHADTLLLMETMDEIRRKAGIHYPADK